LFLPFKGTWHESIEISIKTIILSLQKAAFEVAFRCIFTQTLLQLRGQRAYFHSDYKCID